MFWIVFPIIWITTGIMTVLGLIHYMYTKEGETDMDLGTILICILCVFIWPLVFGFLVKEYVTENANKKIIDLDKTYDFLFGKEVFDEEEPANVDEYNERIGAE